jgi:hypothetical protein
VIDLANPSPPMGWRSRERAAFTERVRPDLVLCLAVVHHLALTNTAPFEHIVDLLADFDAPLVVEFPHPDDTDGRAPPRPQAHRGVRPLPARSPGSRPARPLRRRDQPDPGHPDALPLQAGQLHGRMTVADAAAAPRPTAGDRPRGGGRGTRAAGVRRAVRAGGFAIAQPLYEIFGRAPDQFIFRGATSSDIVAFALILLVGPALAVWALEVMVGLVSPRARRVLHVAALGALAAAFAVQALRGLLTGWWLLVLGAVLGAIAALLYVRTAAARMWLAFAAIAPPAFCALFLLSSQTAQLLDGTSARSDVAIGDPRPVVMVVLDEGPLASIMTSEGRGRCRAVPPHRPSRRGRHLVPQHHGRQQLHLDRCALDRERHPPRDGTTPVAASHPDNVFTLLGEGMELNVVESVTRLCPDQLCEPRPRRQGGLRGILSMPPVMRTRLSPAGATGDPVAGLVEANAEEGEGPADTRTPAQKTPSSVRTFIDGIDDDPNGFHYLHVLLPTCRSGCCPTAPSTQPRPRPRARRRELGGPALARATGPSATPAADAVHRRGDRSDHRSHGGVGIYDDATFMLTSDHGISFEPGGRDPRPRQHPPDLRRRAWPS